MKKISAILEDHWHTPNLLLSVILYPLSRLFQLIVSIRRRFYQLGWFKSYRLPVPVVIIGNIHVGGTGKTPIVMTLAKDLHKAGYQIGIISKGYGRINQKTLIVDVNGRQEDYGDEPLMLAQETNAHIAVSKNRIEAGQLLLKQFPEIQIILCDDGLQHYALERDFEIIVYPEQDIKKTLDVLPNGPLRETKKRLESVDAIIVSNNTLLYKDKAKDIDSTLAKTILHGVNKHLKLPKKASKHISYLHPAKIYQLNQPNHEVEPEYFADKQVTALCAIGRPGRFFNTLKDLDIPIHHKIILPDHANIQGGDIPRDASHVIMTQKDATKLTHLKLNHVWVLPVCAIIEPDLLPRLTALTESHTQE